MKELRRSTVVLTLINQQYFKTQPFKLLSAVNTLLPEMMIVFWVFFILHNLTGWFQIKIQLYHYSDQK